MPLAVEGQVEQSLWHVEQLSVPLHTPSPHTTEVVVPPSSAGVPESVPPSTPGAPESVPPSVPGVPESMPASAPHFLAPCPRHRKELESSTVPSCSSPPHPPVARPHWIATA